MAEVPRKVDARTLTEKIWGSDFINSIPEGWRTALKYLRIKIPGVNNGTDPDTLTDTLVTSQVTTNRINELEKESLQLTTGISDEVEHEQDYDEQFDVVIPKTRYLTKDNAEVGLPRRRIRAFNPKVSEVETFDASALEAVLGSYVLSFPGTTSLQLPDVLEGVSCTMEKTGADGNWNESGGAAWAGAGSAAISLGGTADASAVIMPTLAIRIKQPFAHHVPTQHHLFFMKLPVTTASVIAKLSQLLGGVTVLPWPKFKPKIETIQLIGQERRMSVRATTHWQDGGGCSSCGGDPFGTSEHSQATGYGTSHAVGINIRTVTIPPTIHDDMTIAGTTDDTESGTGSISIVLGSLLTIAGSEILTVEGQIKGTITRSDDDFVIPTSGLRVLDIQAEPYRFGYAKVHTEVFDFADL